MAFQDDDGADPAPPLVPGPPLPPGAGAAPPLPPLPSDGGPQPPLPPTTDAKEQVEEEEEDPLVVAQRRREEEEQALQEAADIHEDDDPLLKEFYADMKAVDRENEVNRILGAFKLNPYEQLGLRFDVEPSDIARQYRKSSLMVHPDKCSHPKAKPAFEIIGEALKQLKDPERKRVLDEYLGVAKEQVLKDWRKAAKHDAAVRVASSMDQRGLEGVQAAYEETQQFHDAWKLKARDVLARSEWHRRKQIKRIKEDEERALAELKEEKSLAKRLKNEEKRWEKTRESRVGTWRDFQSGKSKKSKAMSGIKPPKAKEEDSDKRYIQRAVGEQFRPNQK